MIKLLSILITLILALSFFISSAKAAGTAKFTLSPNSLTKSVGSTLSINVVLDTGGDSINSAGAFLSFPPENLEASVDTTKSFATFFSQKEVDNTTGKINLNAAVSDPKSGSNLILATLNFKVEKAGTAVISFSDKSVVYKGSVNILSTYTGGTYTLTSSDSTSLPTATSSPTASASSASNLPKSGAVEFSFTLILVALTALGISFGLSRLSH